MKWVLLLLNSFMEEMKTWGLSNIFKVPRLINEARTQQSVSKDCPLHHCPLWFLGGSNLPSLNLHYPVWIFLAHDNAVPHMTSNYFMCASFIY